MSIRYLGRCGVLALLLLILLQTTSEAQRPGDTPPTPDPIPAVPVHVLKGGARACLIQSEDGKTLLASGDGSLRIWDLATGQEVKRVEDPLFKRRIIPTPDGKLWLMPFQYPDIPGLGMECRLIDPHTHKVVRILERTEKTNSATCFSPDGKLFFARMNNQGGCVWDVASGKLVTTPLFDKIEGSIEGFQFAPNGRLVAVGTASLPLHLLDARSGQVVWIADRVGFQGRNHAFSPDSRLLAGGQLNVNELCLFDAPTGKVLAQLKWQQDQTLIPGLPFPQPDPNRLAGVACVAFAPDGRTFLAACADRRLVVVETATWQMRFRFDTNHQWGQLVVLHHGFLVATSTLAQGTPLQLWDRMNPALAKEKVTEAQLQQSLPALESPDAAAAWAVMRRLSTNPTEALPVLRRAVKPVPPADEKTLTGFLHALDDNDFDVRERAEQRLKELGSVAQAALLAAVKTDLSPDTRKRVQDLLAHHQDRANPVRLRALRATEVLEYLASDEARKLLEEWRAGAAGAYLTDEATASMSRLSR
jgi:WD40 repeat protein